MANMGKRLWLTVIAVFLSVMLFAQEKSDSSTSLNGTMRSNNKIYVVMAVCLTILAGLILYLVRIDRKISKTEKEIS